MKHPYIRGRVESFVNTWNQVISDGSYAEAINYNVVVTYPNGLKVSRSDIAEPARTQVRETK